MRVNYILFNDQLTIDNTLLVSTDNRSFRYGDGIFETMLWRNGSIRFLDEHIQRLQNGLNVLQIENAYRFDHGFIHQRVFQLIEKNSLIDEDVRVRLQVFRQGGGLYSPLNNNPGYVLSVHPLGNDPQPHQQKSGLIVGLYTDQFKPFSGLSALKSCNSLVYVLAGNYRKKQGLDEVILLNQEGMICEGVQNNIFVVYQGTLFTPALNQGCVAGIMRGVVIGLARELGIDVVEAKIDPLVLDEAEEIFMTNAIRGIQWVVGYKKRRFFNKYSKLFQEKLEILSGI
jgi:branched-chain amino acid aminotransferase